MSPPEQPGRRNALPPGADASPVVTSRAAIVGFVPQRLPFAAPTNRSAAPRTRPRGRLGILLFGCYLSVLALSPW